MPHADTTRCCRRPPVERVGSGTALDDVVVCVAGDLVRARSADQVFEIRKRVGVRYGSVEISGRAVECYGYRGGDTREADGISDGRIVSTVEVVAAQPAIDDVITVTTLNRVGVLVSGQRVAIDATGQIFETGNRVLAVRSRILKSS